MQILIDISEVRYKDIQRIASVQLESNYFKTAEQIIANGIPLPKNHGRLIDADTLIRKAHEEAQGMTNNNFGVEVEWLVDKNPTIIEADKEEEK